MTAGATTYPNTMRRADGRVLILVENNAYPQDTRVRQEANALVTAGYEVTVIAPRFMGQPFSEAVAGLHVLRYPAPRQGRGVLGYLFEYGYSLLVMFLLTIVVWWTRGFDVIHAGNPPDVLVSIGAFYRILGKRFVFDHHDLSPEMYRALFGERSKPGITRALVMCERWSCRVANHVISTNESYRRVAIERAGADPTHVTVVRNGPDGRWFRRTEPDAALRSRNQVILGYVGDMGDRDGIDHLLRALHHLTYERGRRDY